MSETLHEQKPAKFLPAFFVDEIDRRRSFSSGELPRHITLLSPLRTHYDGAVYSRQLKQQFNHFEPFTVTVGESDRFTHDNQKIDVRRVVDGGDRLGRVRQALFDILGKIDHDRTYDDLFVPHISVPGEIDKLLVREGQRVYVGGFSIVEKESTGLWRVRDKIGFHGDDDASEA